MDCIIRASKHSARRQAIDIHLRRSDAIFLFRRNLLMTEPASCRHPRTRVIAKDSDAEYVECLDCGEIFEVGELKEPSEFPESLSDA